MVSSFTIIKGSLINETYATFESWDFSLPKAENLRRLRADNLIEAGSDNWLRDVRKVLNRRFDPEGRDRPLVELAQNGCDRNVWRPLLLWHLTRDEFLVRDFLINWLYPQYLEGAYRLRSEDVLPYLQGLSRNGDITWAGSWSDSTTERVATGLLRIAADFGLLTGEVVKEFDSYHLPDDSFMYLLHAVAEDQPNARRVIDSPEWHMYLLEADGIERELLHLHQFQKLGFEAAGSLARLDLPAQTAAAYARELVA